MTRSLTLPLYGLRSSLLNWGFQNTYPIYAKIWKPKLVSWSKTRKDLRQCPAGSLGALMGQFQEENNIDFIPGFENHDVFHLLLNYGTTAPEEVLLQCCLIGNGKRSPYALTAGFIGVLLFPEHWCFFKEAFRRGQKMRQFHQWKFEYLLHENLAALQAFINKKTLPKRHQPKSFF